METPDECVKSGVFTVNFKHIPHLALVFLVFLLLTLNRKNLGWVVRATAPKYCDIALLLFVRSV